MGKMFEMLQDSLLEAIEYEKGNKKLRSKKINIPNEPKKYDAVSIQALRNSLGMSQRDFALWLNVSENTVKSWEQGVRNPSHCALRLLEVFEIGFSVVKKMYKHPHFVRID